MSNAANSFEGLMKIILFGLQCELCVLYFDDILSYSSSLDKMIENLETIFQRFEQANLKLKPPKCKVFQTKVDFLGHVVSKEGIYLVILVK